jgi:hypothetical protein
MSIAEWLAVRLFPNSRWARRKVRGNWHENALAKRVAESGGPSSKPRRRMRRRISIVSGRTKFLILSLFVGRKKHHGHHTHHRRPRSPR